MPVNDNGDERLCQLLAMGIFLKFLLIRKSKEYFQLVLFHSYGQLTWCYVQDSVACSYFCVDVVFVFEMFVILMRTELNMWFLFLIRGYDIALRTELSLGSHSF